MTDLEPIPDSALKRLGGELAQLLDDDQWNNTEKRYLLPALEEQEALRSRAEAADAERDALLRPGDWVEAQIKSGKITLGAQIIDKQNAEIDRLQAEVARLTSGLREMRAISPDCDCSICLVLVRLLGGEGE